jgi:putative DNA primase/helicase
MSAAPNSAGDLEELRAALIADIERLAETLLGPPNKTASNKRQLRFGGSNGMVVELRGRKRGLWFFHNLGHGDGPFDLIMHAHGCDFWRAVDWARGWAKMETAPRPRPRPRPVEPSQADLEEQAETAKAISTARQMAHAADAMVEMSSRTLAAETYLSQTRGIPRPAEGWPSCIRYHAPTRSLLAVATLSDGAVHAVQRVRLTPAGEKAEATPEQPVKVTNGRQLGAIVRLPRRVGANPELASSLLLAEGPENGLSVWAATGCETWLVFGVGMFKRIELPAGRRVILCRDDDRQHSAADKAVRAAVIGWRKAGGDVAVATPWIAGKTNPISTTCCVVKGVLESSRGCCVTPRLSHHRLVPAHRS